MDRSYTLPEGWSYKELKEIANVISGVSFNPDDITEDGIRILRSGNIQDGYVLLKNDDVFLNDSYYNKLNTIQYLDNCITSSTGSIGVLGKCGTIFDNIEKAQIGSFLRLVRSRDLENALYLSLILHSPFYCQYIRQFAKNGTSINNIKSEHLEKFKFPFPPKALKDRISRFYLLLEQKVLLNRRMISELEAIAKQLYDYWFVQFDFPDKDGKPYKSSGGKMTYNERLKRAIPTGWDVIEIGEVLDKVTSTPHLITDEYINQGIYPIIDQTKDIYFAGFTNREDAVLKQYPVVVFGDHSCAVKYVNFPFVRGADGTQIMLSKNKQISCEYLYFAIKNIRLNKGYARHYSFVKDSLIIVPSKNIALLYETITSNLFNHISQKRFENVRFTNFRDSLLPMLMNGQVTVE